MVPLHDRGYLLSEQKRNAVLSLAEVEAYGRDSYGDPEYVSIYGLRPAVWHARGIRLLARTVVECTRDRLADRIGRDIAELMRAAPSVSGSVVIDPFAGSCNTVFWIKHHVGPRATIGFELDDAVFETTRTNLALVAADVVLMHADYTSGVNALSILEDELLIVFVAPPWGGALSATGALDLSRTTPPVTEIIGRFAAAFPDHKVVFAIQVYETVVAGSLTEVTSRCDWSALETYDVNAPGQNHGLLLGTRGWAP